MPPESRPDRPRPAQASCLAWWCGSWSDWTPRRRCRYAELCIAATAMARKARRDFQPPPMSRGRDITSARPAVPSGGRSAGTRGCREIGRPLVHQPSVPLEQVRPRVGHLDLVLDHVRQRGLDDFTRMIRLLGRPVTERRAEAVRPPRQSVKLLICSRLRHPIRPSSPCSTPQCAPDDTAP